MLNVDEILKLKELLDKGIITQEEFEKKKKELLEKNVEETQNKENNKEINSSIEKKKKSGCLSTCIMALIVAFVIFGNLVIEPSNEKFYNNQQVLEGIITSTEDFSNIVRQCGFSDYTLERDELLDELDGEGTIGVRIKMPNVNGVIYIKDGTVYSVRYADNYLYKDGAIQHTLSDYIITQDEKVNLINITQEIIKTILKSPSTAKFPWNYDEWATGKQDGKTIVQGYVDSQNSFGATIRSEFQVTYTDGIVTSLIFDGQEYIK